MKFFALWTLCFSLTFNLYAYTKGKLYKLTILHTNDHHGRFWPNKEGEVGLAARSTLINQLREQIRSEGGHVLLLDAGDVNTGVPQSDLQDAEPDFKGMALMGYDVMAIGNHEFDKPLETIFKQREWAGFPFISANIYYQESNQRVFPSHISKEADDLKITIFGLTTEDTPLKTNPHHTKGLKFVPAVEEAKKLVPTLRKDSDVLIALTHMGHHPNESHGPDAPGDVTLARQVNGIDLIVGGHTQKPLFEADVQNGAIIVQAFEWGKYLGRVDLEFLDGRLTLKNYQLIPVNLKTSETKIEADPVIESMLRPFKEKGDASLLVELGSADTEFIGRRDVVRFQETNLGNLVTASYKEKFNADLAISNSGGLRDSLYPGKVTYESVLMVLPFGGEVVTAQMTGKELKNYLSTLIFDLTPGSGSFPQMSGVRLVADASTRTLRQININGRPLREKCSYKIALPEFIAGGGDRYPKIDYSKTGFVDADILKEYVLKKKELRGIDYAPSHYIQHISKP
jgi:5'-nucleotidase / UDP-sugar diphosphatase